MSLKEILKIKYDSFNSNELSWFTYELIQHLIQGNEDNLAQIILIKHNLDYPS